MSGIQAQTTPCTGRRSPRAPAVMAGWVFASVLLLTPARMPAQVSPEEHAKHHPATGPAATSQPAGGTQAGMGGMMEMMKGMMGGTPKKELYPSLMALAELSPKERDTVAIQAHERMKAGAALISEGLGRLAETASSNDFATMQEASAKMREGLAQFESGVAAHRALAEGKPPRDIALQWFRSEMSLPHPTGNVPAAPTSWFHTTVMALLILFAVVMIWMYFFKMRRAALLLQGLMGTPSAVRAVPAGILTAPVAPAATVPALTTTVQPAAGKWSGKLNVGRIFQETPDVKTFRLMNPLGGVLPLSHLPGQFLTITVPVDGKPVKRSYTIASSPTQHDFLEITVKHENEGVVSGHLHDRVKRGDLLECAGPSGSFIFTGRECKCILLIAGGVGITPLMSVIRYLTDRSWPGDVYLLYGVRSPQDIIFREELEYLQRRHPNFRVVITASRAEGTDWKGPTGRITKELITQSVPDLASRYMHVCGPVPMMEAVKQMLSELGVPAGRIKTEAFGPALGKPEPALQLSAAPAARKAVAVPTATFSESDKSAPLPPDKSILDVADEIGVEIDNSCRVGTCGTCRVKLLAGKVTMSVEDGLEPGDKEKGIILACQAKSAGDVTVDA